MREYLNRAVANPHYKLLSFAIALLAWSYVQLEQISESPVRVRVDWQLPSGLISVEQLPSTATLTLRGTGADLRRARAAPLRLPIDLGASGVGEQRVEFTAFRAEGLPETLEVIGTTPTAMTVTLDEVAERKVALNPVRIGDPADGYLVGSVVLEPSVLRVRGPRGVIASMMRVNSRPVDVSGLTSDAEVPAELDLPRSVSVVDGIGVSARISVVPELERRTLSAVPILVWQQAGWVAQPSSLEVTLEGPAAAIAAVSVEDVVAFAHLPDAPDRAAYEALWGPKQGVRLRVLHGAGDAVVTVRVEPAKVEVIRR